MSRNRARTGLTKPRQTEHALREASWRENGGALASGADKQAAERLAETRAASVALGVDVTEVPIPVRNPLADLLLFASLATGEDPDTGEFALAFAKLRRCGCDGPDGIERLKEIMPPSPAEVGLAKIVSEYVGSKEAAAEHAAAVLGVPSTSFDGAVKQVKRTTR